MASASVSGARICGAKYPDSKARCTQPAAHSGNHCSAAFGVLWPNAESFALRRGTRVRYGARGEGVVVAVDRQGAADRTAVIRLDSGSEKKVVLRVAPLRLASSPRGQAEDAAQFTVCLGCGDSVPVAPD